jgi:hypothetical protein
VCRKVETERSPHRFLRSSLEPRFLPEGRGGFDEDELARLSEEARKTHAAEP